jgi:hypothetical protein
MKSYRDLDDCLLRDLVKMTHLNYLNAYGIVEPDGMLSEEDAAQMNLFTAGEAWEMAQRLEKAFDALGAQKRAELQTA